MLINDLGGNRSNNCYAQPSGSQAQLLGTMAGQLTYVVPSTSAPGTFVSFWCGGEAGGPARSNIAQFTVTGSPDVDSDGDGVPDARDNCPREVGPVDNGGCPAPVDSDGDGLTDNIDACPNAFGPRELNGCAPTATPIPLPVLPTDGACVLATLGPDAVNVRQGTSTDTAIVGSLNPFEIYSVIGRNADSSWLQINGGWVAAFVTRQGGNCSTLPQTDGVELVPTQPELVPTQAQLTAPDDGSTQVGLLLPAVQQAREAAARMEGCQGLIPQVNALPTFLALSIINQADPCAAAQSQIDDLFFNPQPVQDVSFPSCTSVLGEEIGTLGSDTFFSIYSRVPVETRDYLASIAQGEIGDYCLLLFDLAHGGVTSTSSPVAEHNIPMSMAYCDVPDTDDMLAKIAAVNVDPVEFSSLSSTCGFYEDIGLLGTTTQANVDYFNMLVNSCGGQVDEVSNRAFSDAVRGAFDAGAAAAQGCPGFQLLENYPLSQDLQPALPQVANGNGQCTGNFRILATHNPSLGMETLYRILKSIDPCGAAIEYAADGSVPNNVPAPPECIQGDTMTLGAAIFNQTEVDASSPWYIKIAALDRPTNELCAPVGQGNDGFTVLPTPTQGAFVANPTATLPQIGVLPTSTPLPTNTPPVIIANPTSEATATELGLIANPTAADGVVATPTFTPTESPPEQALPTNTPALLPTATPLAEVVPPTAVPPTEGPGVGEGQPTDLGTCFGCVPDDPILPSGRARVIMIGADENGNFAGIFALPSSANPNPENGSLGLVQLPLDPMSQPMPDSPVVLSPDGKTFGFFAQGIDPAGLPSTVRRIQVAGPDGSSQTDTAPREHVSLNFTRIETTYGNDEALSIDTIISFPPSLTPVMSAPSWSADGSTLFMTLADANGTPSIYALQIGNGRDVQVPLLVADNAFDPAVAPNGRYLAFVRNDPTGRNIYALELNRLQENPITQQMQGAACYAPQFGPTSLKIYFNCEYNGQLQMYRYGLDGINPIDTGIEGARDPMPDETDGMIYFNDGASIFRIPTEGEPAVPLAYKLKPVLITSYSTSGSAD
ncbi:MAG: hypothetical protein CL607_00325 [Anaerolineaceae bacterium]|nr:hypothetical protein [Anaerolineaceae bacterium]